MAYWERVAVPPDFKGSTRAERQGGSYLRYHPDVLTESSNALSADVLEYAADVTTGLLRLGERLRANPLPILYSTSVRSESISSSWIEGIRETARAVALAQIAEDGASHAASQIVRNVAAMREAIDLLGAGEWRHDHIQQIHHDLVSWLKPGYRNEQVWIGGTNKFDAAYAGPPADRVHALMDDLLGYANTSGDLVVVQAAIIHAQFETIHPFSDGNGRVGRALVHGVFKRAGLVDGGVVPLSSILRKDVDGYVTALTSYRYDGDARAEALNSYVESFLGYLEAAVRAAQQFVDPATSVHRRWAEAVAGVRSDSALRRAVDVIAENPVVSTRFLSETLGVSGVTATKIIDQLQQVGILDPAGGKYKRLALYQADEILRLLDLGTEAPGGSTAVPFAESPSATGAVELIHRCGRPTASGPCRNRVPEPGQACWRHR